MACYCNTIPCAHSKNDTKMKYEQLELTDIRRIKNMSRAELEDECLRFLKLRYVLEWFGPIDWDYAPILEEGGEEAGWGARFVYEDREYSYTADHVTDAIMGLAEEMGYRSPIETDSTLYTGVD